MIRQLDHLVILVDDLDRAVRDYTTLGFNVVAGGEHSDGATHNALIAFGDGTYLELIAFRREAPTHRWWRHTASGEGLIDWAVLPSDTAEDVAAARERGLVLDGPIDGGRIRPDGVALRWQTGLPPSPDLPFLCGDITPRSLRVPHGAAHEHPNGARGIARLTVGVSDLRASAARYHALLGRPPSTQDDGAATWSLGDTRMVLAAPGDQADDALHHHLVQRGEGPFAVVLRADRGAQADLDPLLTHGVHLRLDPRTAAHDA